MSTKKIFFIVACCLCFTTIYAQNEFNLNKKFSFKDYCFDKNIKTILAYKTGNELSEPSIELNGGESVTFTFDDLNETEREFYYTITHCNADWDEDNTFVGDYMNGLNQNNIFTFKSSANTLVSYKNYKFEIPNEDVEITTSGNFLVNVYDKNTDSIVFRKGFKVYEQKAIINLSYKLSFNDINRGRQQLDFSINRGKLNVQNPDSEIKVRVEQNSQRMPYAKLPNIMFQNNMVFDYSGVLKNIYKGENEYRMFDTRNLSYNAQGVNKIIKKHNQYHVLLNIDAPVNDWTYDYKRDINGKYFIDSDRINKKSDKNTESDYVYVYFTISANDIEPDKNIYIYGEISDWGLKPDCKMEYNSDRNAYETTILLKQGLYNYKYVEIDNNGNFISDFFDKSFSQTENDYVVYVYFRGFGDRWDKLVATSGINSTSGK